MRTSSYNLFVQEENRVLAVNLLSRAAIELSPESYDTLERWGRSGIPRELDEDEKEFAEFVSRNLFLVDDGFDELGYIREQTRRERFHTRQLGLVIAPTMGCNFSCHYCFEDKANVYLDETAQSRILDLVARRLGTFDDLSIQWFGGEPLRALGVIEPLSRGLLRLAAAHDFSYAATVITNGYLMDRATALQLRELGVCRVQITLDGDRPLHDRTRRERGGAGSFNQILENIRQVPDDIAVTVRVHLAPFNYQSILDLLDTLKKEGMEQHINTLYFAPLFNYRVGMTSQPYRTDGKRFASSEEFASLQIPVLEKARNLGFRLKDFLDVSYGICTAVRGDTMVIDAEGRLVKCYKDCGVAGEAFGDLDGNPGPRENLDKWIDVEVPRDEECRRCKFLPICLGGCSKQWQEGADKSVICTPLRYNYEDQIRIYFRNI